VTALLEVEGLHAHYGKSHILHGVGFAIGVGEIVSLLGRNGSGRSTTLKTIMGLVRPTAGAVRLDGVDLAGRRAFRIARAGIAYVPEEREIFANLTVDENLRLGIQEGARRLASMGVGADVRLLSAAQGAPQHPCRTAVGRRAADAHHLSLAAR